MGSGEVRLNPHCLPEMSYRGIDAPAAHQDQAEVVVRFGVVGPHLQRPLQQRNGRAEISLVGEARPRFM